MILLLVLSCSLFCGCSRGSLPESETMKIDDSLKEYLELVPEPVILAIQSEGYTIELVDDPGKDYNIEHISGLTIPELKEILIKNDEKKYRQAVVHEIFHAYDDTLNFISESDEFISIYNEEKEKMVVTGFISAGQYKVNEKEYFAEACQMWVYDKETLKESAPKTYDFINDLLKNLS